MYGTPYTRSGIKKYDNDPAVQAVINAWTIPGHNSYWHEKMKRNVREQMPVLARALDRLAEGK